MKNQKIMGVQPHQIYLHLSASIYDSCKKTRKVAKRKYRMKSTVKLSLLDMAAQYYIHVNMEGDKLLEVQPLTEP